MIGSSPVLSVSDFVAIFNQSLDMMYPSVVIAGELSNMRVSKGAWLYFDLKDEQSSVKFFGSVRALPGPLEDGMTIEVVGRPYLHPRFGFSIQVIAIQATGAGSIKKAQDLLRTKLEAEGLFDPSRKRTLPYPPQKIGLVTSVESAAYGDFTKIIRKRWPALEIQVFDTLVQGQDAPAQLVESLAAANQHLDLDAIVMIRGGGSKDDLVAFDHEQVVRAIAGSRIPTMVAIGHERDVSLAELAADVRASTPSNAAELLTPDQDHERALLLRIEAGLDSAMLARIADARRTLKQAHEDALYSVGLVVARSRQYLQSQSTLIDALDPRLPLQRGFALVRQDGVVVRTRAALDMGKPTELEFGDGKVTLQ